MTRRSCLVSLVCAVAATACDPEPVTVVHVTVDRLPAVWPLAEIEVTLGNDNATVVETFDVEDRQLPVSFTVTPTGRTGSLEVSLSARDEAGLLRATGAGAVDIEPDRRTDLTVTLEPTDFVVNTSIAGIQRLTFVGGRGGRQIAAGPDGAFTPVFVNDCSMLGRCDVFARRFDPDGFPADNGITMDDGDFIANLSDDFAAVPTVAVGADRMFLAWQTGSDVRGVALTADARHVGFVDTILSTNDQLPRDPAVAALADGSFAVVWSEDSTQGRVIRGRLVDAEGQPLVNPVTDDDQDFPVTSVDNGEAEVPAIAATGSGRGFTVVWRDRGSLYARFFDEQAFPRPAEQVALVAHSTNAVVSAPQLAPAGDRIAVTWRVRDFAEPGLDDGEVFVRRFTGPTGSAIGPALHLLDSTEDTNTTPDIAAGPDGALAVTWHDCATDGDGSGCGVFAQILRPTMLPVGEPFRVNTTTLEDQTDPSIDGRPDGFVAAWSDTSEQPPDTDQGSIRARVLYPDTDPNDGRRGARCGRSDDAPCDAGLVCLAGSQDTPRCHESCDPSTSEPCPDGGVCTTMGEVSGCIF